MKGINSFKSSHPVLFSVLIICTFCILTELARSLLLLCGFQADGTLRWYLPGETAILIISVALLVIAGQTHILGQRKGFFRTLWSGAIFIVLALVGSYVLISDALSQGKTFCAVPQMLLFVLFVLLVGVAEEILFRGIITDVLLERYGNKPTGVALAVVLSGLLFALSHAPNALHGQPIGETIVQIVAMCMTGPLFAAIYVKHKNIYGVALLHAALNFMTMCAAGLFGEGLLSHSVVEFDFWGEIRQCLISQSVFVITCICILHPGVLRRIAARQIQQDC